MSIIYPEYPMMCITCCPQYCDLAVQHVSKCQGRKDKVSKSMYRTPGHTPASCFPVSSASYQALLSASHLTQTSPILTCWTRGSGAHGIASGSTQSGWFPRSRILVENIFYTICSIDIWQVHRKMSYMHPNASHAEELFKLAGNGMAMRALYVAQATILKSMCPRLLGKYLAN